MGKLDWDYEFIVKVVAREAWYLRRRLPSQSMVDIDDLIQIGLLKAVEIRDRYRFRRGKFTTFLTPVVRNAFADVLSKEWSRARYPMVGPEPLKTIMTDPGEEDRRWAELELALGLPFTNDMSLKWGFDQIRYDRAPPDPASLTGRRLRALTSRALGVQGVNQNDRALQEQIEILPDDLVELSLLVGIEPKPTDSAWRAAVLKKLPDCFGVVENGQPVRNVDFREVDRTFPCRDCRAEAYCAKIVGHLSWPEERVRREQAGESDPPPVRIKPKKLVKGNRRNKHRDRPYSPTRGSRTHCLLLWVLAGNMTYPQMRVEMDKKFPRVKSYKNKILIRVMLSCFNNRRHRQYVGKILRTKRGKIRFWRPELVRKRLGLTTGKISKKTK